MDQLQSATRTPAGVGLFLHSPAILVHPIWNEQLRHFCKRIVDYVGSDASLYCRSYEAGGGRNIACDIKGTEGAVSITVFVTGEIHLPEHSEFERGRLGLENRIELEFPVTNDFDALCLFGALAHDTSSVPTAGVDAGPKPSTR